MIVTFDYAAASEIVRPLAVFVFGIVLYALFVFKFYRFLAQKDIFDFNLAQYNSATFAPLRKFIRFIFYIVEYIILFPMFVFFWFGVLTVLLLFLSKNQSVETVLLISMALVGAVRACAYFTEDLAKDLSKMLPFALLGVFLVDVSYFSGLESLQKIYEIPNHIQVLFYYYLFVIGLEFLLRLLSGFVEAAVPAKEESVE